jgi:DNA repair exonuclease SbcCD ATPase subunit
MNINKIIVEKYGDLRFDPINFNEGFNLVYANNGVGKTSLVKAIFLTLFGKSTPFFDYYGKTISEAGRIEVDLEVNLDNTIHTLSLEKVSNTVPKKTKELFEHSEHLKYAASNYFITDSSMVRDISKSINFDQNGQQQLQQLISSATSGNDLIEKSLNTHLKRITDLIKFGTSGKINKSSLTQLTKELGDKLDELKMAKTKLKDAPDLDLNVIEDLQNDLGLLESSYDELNSKLRILEGKEQWLKSFVKVSKNFETKILNNFSLTKYGKTAFEKLIEDINSLKLNEESYESTKGNLRKDSSEFKEITKNKKGETSVKVNIESLEIQFDNIKQIQGEVIQLEENKNAKKGLFENIKKDLDLLTKPLYQLASKDEGKLTKAQISKIYNFNKSFFENDKNLKNNQPEIDELLKNIKNLQGNKNTIEIKEIIDKVETSFEQNKDSLNQILSQDTTKAVINKLKKQIIDNERKALSNFVSIDKNLDIIAKHKSNIDSLQRLETKREDIEGEIKTLKASINKFWKESNIPYQIITSVNVDSYIEAFDKIYEVHKEATSAESILPEKEATLKAKVNEFKKATQEFGYKFDLVNDVDFSDIKVASTKHNKLVNSQESFEGKINELNAAINLHNNSIQQFENLRDKKLKEYGLDTLNGLYQLITLVEEIKILTSDSQFKDLENSELESLLKGSIEGIITPKVLGNDLTQLHSEIKSLDTERKIKRSELAKVELEAKKEPEFVMEHLKNDELSLVEQIQDLKKEYLAIVLGIFLAIKQLNSTDTDNINFLKIVNEVLPNINSQFTSFNLDEETQQVSLGYNDTRKDFTRNPDEFSQGEIASIALSLRLAIQSASSKNGFVFPFIYDDCTEELDNEKEDNFFNELFKLSDENQIIYLTHNYDLVEKLKSRAEPSHIIELENFRNL